MNKILNSQILLTIKREVKKLSPETAGWVALLCLLSATLPNLFALMVGITDNPLPVDIVLVLWSGITMLFLKATLQKDLLTMFTIGLGFIFQCIIMALIFFK